MEGERIGPTENVGEGGSTSLEPAADRRFWWILGAIVLVALVVRIVLVLALPDGRNCVDQGLPPSVDCSVGGPVHGGLGGDGGVYQAIAALVADGQGFTNPFNGQPYAQQAPLWTVVLAGADAAGLRATREQQLLFTILGAATVAVVGLVGRRVASASAGLVAAGIAAFWPGFWLYEQNLNTETVTTLLVAVVILASYRFRERPSVGRTVALAAAIGLAVLGRSELVLLLPALLLPLVVGARSLSWRGRVVRLAGAVVLVVAMLAPWSMYNSGRFERPVLLSNGFGYTAKAGACDATFDGDRMGSFSSRGCLLLLPEAAILDETVRDAALRSAAVSYTRAHIGRAPLVVLAREGRTWSLYRPGQHVGFNEQLLNTPAWTLWFQTVALWVALPLSVLGAVALRRRGTAIYPLLVFPLIVVVSTAITFGDPRYRSISEVSIVVLVAVTVDAAARRFHRRPRPISRRASTVSEAGSPPVTNW